MENNKNHILVVDDDDRIRNLLKDYLSENNYIVSTAKNAEEAKNRLKYLKFDTIIFTNTYMHGRARTRRAPSSEKDAELAQKLGQLQPFLAVFPQEFVGQRASFGPT